MSTSGRSLGPAWEELRRVFDLGPVGGLSDGELLERFLERRDRGGEAAFAALVDRHGPTVLGVCRRLLGDPHAADDAFQATFLVLARRAPTIAGRDRVGNWLYGVALRVSKEARTRNARLRARERPLAVVDPAGIGAGRAGADPTDPSSGPSADDLRDTIAEELSRLAERYRAPLLLCDLEGLSRQAAALRLGIPEGTLSSRLARGRAILRQRLTRRGLAPAGAVASLSLPAKASAAVPASLIRRTAEAAVLFSTREGAAGVVPAAASTLAEGVLITMTWTNLAKLTAATLFGTAALGAGLALASRPEAEHPAPRTIGPIAVQDDEEAEEAPEEQFIGEVQDVGGKPISGATVVVGISRANEPPSRLVLRTDEEGRFAFPSPEVPFGAYLAASREGFAGSTMSSGNDGEGRRSPPPVLRLAPAEAFGAILVDGDGKPVVGAEVRVETIASGPTSKPLPNGGTTTMVIFDHIRWDTLGGTPVARAFSAMTGEDGSFSIPVPARDCGLDLRARTADGRELRIALEGIDGPRELLGQGFLPVIRGPDHPHELARPDRVIADGIRTRDGLGRLILTSRQSARIAGRVISKVPGVDASGLTATADSDGFSADQPRQSGKGRIDASGHFVIEGLVPGVVNVFLGGRPEGATWTYRPAEAVELDWDRTSEATLEVVPGVLAEGRVVDSEGRAVAGAKVAKSGLGGHPDASGPPGGAEADAEGRFQFYLAPGRHHFYIFSLPEGYVRLEDERSSWSGAGSARTVTIPEGVERFELPAIPVDRGRIVEGRVVDGDGRPVVGAGVGFGPPGHRFVTAPVSARSDAEGRYRFRLPPGGFKLFLPELPDGYTIGDESSRTIVIPGDASKIEVPPLVVGRSEA